MSNLVQTLQGFREGSTYYAVGDGFYYCLNRTKGTRKFLKCFRHGRYKCMARASFEVTDRVLSVTVNHNHASEPWVDDLLKERHALKGLAARDIDPLDNNAYGRQQMQEHSGRDDGSSLEATLGMGVGGAMMDHSEAVAGPSGYGDDVRVKMEPEWVDAGALEPNCELEGQYEDTQDFNSAYSDDTTSNQGDQSYHHMFNSQQQQHEHSQQQLPLIPDSQDPVKLRVPGKPNLTITVAPNRPSSTQNSQSMPAPPPLHLLNPMLNRKRGRPRGSQYGSYSESDDRVTTILTDSIIASQKLEKMGASGYQHPNTLAAAVSASLASRVKPRSKDPEAVRAAEIVNSAQNRSGPRVTEELEKVHLKLRQEVLALEVQNLKAEREKLKAYRRNVAIRREIMMLHLQLGKGIPSECASSGRGIEVDSVGNHSKFDFDKDMHAAASTDDSSNSLSKEEITISKRLPDVSISRSQMSHSPKISVRKSLQTLNQSPVSSPSSSICTVRSNTPPPKNTSKPPLEPKETSGNREMPSANQFTRRADNQNQQGSDNSLQSADPISNDDILVSDNRQLMDHDPLDDRVFDDHTNDRPISDNRGMNSNTYQSVTPADLGKEDLGPPDSVSSDLSIEMLSEPGSSQWTNQSSVPMAEAEHDDFGDLQIDEDTYENSENIDQFSASSLAKESSDPQFRSFSNESVHKRRRVENMWEPDEEPL